MLELELDLLTDRQHPIREEPPKPEVVALVLAECEILGQQPAAEQRRPRQTDRCRAIGRDVVIWSGEGAHPREDSGRAPPVERTARRAQPDQLPVTTSVPTIPYASCPGRWQTYR